MFSFLSFFFFDFLFCSQILLPAPRHLRRRKERSASQGRLPAKGHAFSLQQLPKQASCNRGILIESTSSIRVVIIISINAVGVIPIPVVILLKLSSQPIQQASCNWQTCIICCVYNNTPHGRGIPIEVSVSARVVIIISINAVGVIPIPIVIPLKLSLPRSKVNRS